jgi:hypothetical protein
MSGKTTGLGDQLAVAGYLIGGDIQQLSLHGGPALLDSTDITQSAHSRLGGLFDGGISATAFNDPAAGGEHAAFSPLSRSDQIVTYFRGQAIGNPAFSLQSRQLNYDFTRAADGMLTEKVDEQLDQYQEWGVQLTPGPRTDTGATNGTQYDNLASYAFGAQAYLHAVAFTGTDVTVTIQHSATSGSGFTNLMSFSQITGGVPQAQRTSVSNSTTVDRYLRAITTTSGGFTSFEFLVAITVNANAGVTS